VAFILFLLLKGKVRHLGDAGGSDGGAGFRALMTTKGTAKVPTVQRTSVPGYFSLSFSGDAYQQLGGKQFKTIGY
jgi:hypothetical protein